MGCNFSSEKGEKKAKQFQETGAEVFVFIPGTRIPKDVDFTKTLKGHVSASMMERLSALRTRIVVMAAGEISGSLSRMRRKNTTLHGASALADLQQAVEDYLPVLLGLTRKGREIREAVEFAWTNQEDEEKETAISSSLYELLSVLHFMAVLELCRINRVLTQKPTTDGCQAKTAEENRKASVENFLKVSGILEYAINNIMPEIPEELKRKLPADLKEGVLHALSVQALGQGVDIQLGFAIDNLKATLAVKRRLACEQVKCWKQAQESIQSAHIAGVWGHKHGLFIKWKLAEAKAAAYYYHGLILDEGSEENTHANAVTCLQTAHNLVKESRKICAEFCTAAPMTRVPPLWGAMKYLTEKIPKDAVSKARVNASLYCKEKAPEAVPDLPDFSLALQAEEYRLPPIDTLWETEGFTQVTNCSQIYNGHSAE